MVCGVFVHGRKAVHLPPPRLCLQVYDQNTTEKLHMIFRSFILATAISLVLVFTTVSQAQNTTSIVAIVNDEPISSHDINMRTRLYLANSKDMRERLKKKLKEKRTQQLWQKMIEEYRPQSRQEAQKLQKKLVNRLKREVQGSMKGKLKKKILQELVDERIQMQQANKLGVALTDEELDSRLEQIASRNKNRKTGKPLSKEEFLKSLSAMGIPVREFRNRMKAKGSWIRVVRRKFQFQVNIGDKEVDRMIGASSNGKEKLKTVYKLQRVKIAVPVRASERDKANKLLQAEKLRRMVKSCQHLKKAVSKTGATSLESLGTKPGSSFPHTVRAYLENVADGRLTPPVLTSSGVELYAVCDRKKRKIADASKRLAIKEKLRQQEFEILARRYLQDLRQEASIEYR